MFEPIMLIDDDILSIEQNEFLSFDDDRKDILLSMLSIDVQACPGSGKTTLIAAKLILLAKKWKTKSNGVCVLSHTNVAKNEIIYRLQKSKTRKAKNLLSYPHFIGTIQEFVNRYIALPLIRSQGGDIKFIDDNSYVDTMYARLSRKAKNYIDLKNQRGGNVLYDFPLILKNGEIDSIVPSFNQTSTADTFIELKKLRIKMLDEGYFFYKDLYVIAEMALIKNPDLKKIIRKRFPMVLIDEMQDTQKFQDTLLNMIFISGENPSIVQRFGDPDQAIFSKPDGAETNETYNSKQPQEMFKVLNNSNRFLDSIALKVRGLSRNKVKISSAISEERRGLYRQAHAPPGDFRHTLFIYNDTTILNVLTRFSEHVEREFSNSESLVIKALGANGSETSQFTIRNYFPSYHGSKGLKRFKPEYLIDAFHICRDNKQGDFFEYIKLIKEAIIEMLRILNVRDDKGSLLTGRNLDSFLRDKGELLHFREIIFKIIEDSRPLSEESWSLSVQLFKSIFLIGNNHIFLNYREKIFNGRNDSEEGNIFSLNNCKVEVSTIHGVKGETHDATLIMETKNHSFDLSGLLPWLIDQDLAPPTLATKKKFMKQLYVAITRAKHLLCLAIHQDRIAVDQIQKLEDLGWNIDHL